MKWVTEMAIMLSLLIRQKGWFVPQVFQQQLFKYFRHLQSDSSYYQTFQQLKSTNHQTTKVAALCYRINQYHHLHHQSKSLATQPHLLLQKVHLLVQKLYYQSYFQINLEQELLQSCLLNQKNYRVIKIKTQRDHPKDYLCLFALVGHFNQKVKTFMQYFIFK